MQADIAGAFGRGVAGDVRLLDHGAAADRIGDGAVERRARVVISGEAHAVAVVREALALEEVQIARFVERDILLCAEAKAPAFPDPRDRDVGRVGVDPVGPLARKAEQDGAVGGVALAGQGERAVEVDLDPRGPSEPACVAQPLDKAAGGRHRSHSVRGGWTDPDLEEVEDAADQ
jgi:hypothetical protein